jgi:hypothetical protein
LAETAGKLSSAQQDVFLAPRPAEELYRTTDDPDQLQNLVENPRHADAVRRLRAIMRQWRDETADGNPANPSVDGFDRKTGKRLYEARDTSYHRIPAGADQNAHRVNKPGPR